MARGAVSLHKRAETTSCLLVPFVAVTQLLSPTLPPKSTILFVASFGVSYGTSSVGLHFAGDTVLASNACQPPHPPHPASWALALLCVPNSSVLGAAMRSTFVRVNHHGPKMV